jgi:hypothetical protein
MALKVNAVSPTEINVVKDGTTTSLTVLKCGTTAVWGKPFSLTLSIGTNSSMTIKRTSSPNQHASTGALGSGNKIYYGDVLDITVTPDSGYKLTSFTINGTEYGSGQTSSVTKTITVTGAVTVKCTTTTAASWQTVWTGSQTAGSFMWKTTASGTKTKTLANGTPTGIDWSLPTKITGTASCYNNGVQSETTATITDLELSDGVSNLLHEKSGYVGNYLVGVSISIQRNASTPNAVVTGSCSKATGASVMAGASLTLTEVKQYY